MQPTPGSSCHSFHELFGRFASTFDAATPTLQKYITSPDFDVDQVLSDVTTFKDKLYREYREKAIDMVAKWVRDNAGLPEETWMADAVHITPEGRVHLGNKEKPWRMYTLKNGAKYFPSLIQKMSIEGLCVIEEPEFTSIDQLEEFDGSLELRNVHNLTSMKNLQKMSGTLWIRGATGITVFPSLETVGDLRISDVENAIDFPLIRRTKALNLNDIPVGNYPLLQSVEFLAINSPKGEVKQFPNLEFVTGVMPRGSYPIYSVPVSISGLPDGATFRDFFPKLRSIVGENLGKSIAVDSPALIQELNDLKTAGKLSFPGRVVLPEK